jgi:hypothetical protein
MGETMDHRRRAPRRARDTVLSVIKCAKVRQRGRRIVELFAVTRDHALNIDTIASHAFATMAPTRAQRLSATRAARGAPREGDDDKPLKQHPAFKRATRLGDPSPITTSRLRHRSQWTTVALDLRHDAIV